MFIRTPHFRQFQSYAVNNNYCNIADSKTIIAFPVLREDSHQIWALEFPSLGSGHSTKLDTEFKNVWAILLGIRCDSWELSWDGFDDPCGSLLAQHILLFTKISCNFILHLLWSKDLWSHIWFSWWFGSQHQILCTVTFLSLFLSVQKC